MPVFRRHFPHASLIGCDFSGTAVARASERYGDIAGFEVSRLEDIKGHYDVIYSSNTLEHFADYQHKARHMLAHCDHLSILVPYSELREGRPLHADPQREHQVTFREDSLDFLVTEGAAARLQFKVLVCPGMWVWTPAQCVRQTFLNAARMCLGRRLARGPTMISYEICAAPSCRFHEAGEEGVALATATALLVSLVGYVWLVARRCLGLALRASTIGPWLKPVAIATLAACLCYLACLLFDSSGLGTGRLGAATTMGLGFAVLCTVSGLGALAARLLDERDKHALRSAVASLVGRRLMPSARTGA